MTDVTPNYKISVLRMRSEIAQLEAREHAHRLALMELIERRDNTLRNWEAEKGAISGKRETLAELIEAHGEFSSDEIDDAKTVDLEELE